MTEMPENYQPNLEPSQTSNPESTQPAEPPHALEFNPAAALAGSRPQPEQLVVEWSAPSRPYKKRNRQFYTTVAIIVFLISLILFFAGQFLLIAVVISFAFLAYVFYSVPAENVTHQITTYGIRTDGKLYYWDELGRFWFSSLFQQKMVHIEVGRFPHQLTLLLGEIDQETMQELLSEMLLFEQPAPTTFDKAANWLQQQIPLD